MQPLLHRRRVESLGVARVQRAREQPFLCLGLHRVRSEVVQVAGADASAELRVDEPSDEVARVRVLEGQRSADVCRHHVDDVPLAFPADAECVREAPAAVGRNAVAGPVDLCGAITVFHCEYDVLPSLLDPDHFGTVQNPVRIEFQSPALQDRLEPDLWQDRVRTGGHGGVFFFVGAAAPSVPLHDLAPVRPEAGVPRGMAVLGLRGALLDHVLLDAQLPEDLHRALVVPARFGVYGRRRIPLEQNVRDLAERQ